MQYSHKKQNQSDDFSPLKIFPQEGVISDFPKGGYAAAPRPCTTTPCSPQLPKWFD
jgi:hypothetical protein